MSMAQKSKQSNVNLDRCLQEKKGGILTNDIKWNFSKFLVRPFVAPAQKQDQIVSISSIALLLCCGWLKGSLSFPRSRQSFELIYFNKLHASLQVDREGNVVGRCVPGSFMFWSHMAERHGIPLAHLNAAYTCSCCTPDH